MDRRERSGDSQAALLAQQEYFSGELKVAMPGIIQSFDPAKRTCVVQPAVKAQVTDELGAKQWVDMPLLLDCPVFFPGGGGYVLTFPLKAGDECLVVFADRCIDAWWQSGGLQVQAELRMHDLSDGFCLPGLTSVPRVQPSISTNSVYLRNDANASYFQIHDSGNIGVTALGADIYVTAANLHGNISGSADITCGGSCTIAATTINLNGALVINGEAYTAHKHSGVTAGGSNTGPKV